MPEAYRGGWAGLSLGTVSELMGCSYRYCRRLLSSKKKALGRDLTLTDIGDLIFDYKKSKIDRYIDRQISKILDKSNKSII